MAETQVKISGSNAIITIKKNFTVKFPYLTLQFYGAEDGQKLRDCQGCVNGEMYIFGSSLVESVEDKLKKTFGCLGIGVNIMYQKEKYETFSYASHLNESRFMNLMQLNDFGRHMDWVNQLDNL